jgi:hypothetical protein
VIVAPLFLYSPEYPEKLSEKWFGQRSKREFGRYAEHQICQKGASWQSVGLRYEHVRDFSDSV